MHIQPYIESRSSTCAWVRPRRSPERPESGRKMAKFESICSRTTKRENTKSIESHISGVGSIKRVCQLDHAQRLGVLQIEIVQNYGLTGLKQPKLKQRNHNQARIITYTSHTDGLE